METLRIAAKIWPGDKKNLFSHYMSAVFSSLKPDTGVCFLPDMWLIWGEGKERAGPRGLCSQSHISPFPATHLSSWMCLPSFPTERLADGCQCRCPSIWDALISDFILPKSLREEKTPVRSWKRQEQTPLGCSDLCPWDASGQLLTFHVGKIKAQQGSFTRTSFSGGRKKTRAAICYQGSWIQVPPALVFV